MQGRFSRWWYRAFGAPAAERPPSLAFTFAALGRLAKASGRVTEAHVGFVEGLIQTLGFTPSQRERAIDDFRAGKSNLYDFEPLAGAVRTEAPSQVLIELMVECLYRVCWIHGPPHPQTRALLQELTTHLRLPDLDRQRFERRMAEMYQQSLSAELLDAYSRLEVLPQADDGEVKAAFRRQASRHHPDKHPDDPASHEGFIAAQTAWRTIEAHRHPRPPRRVDRNRQPG